MTESSSVASPIVQVRHTPRQLALVAAAVSLIASAASAAMFVQTIERFGFRDLFAALFWATPLALSIFLSFLLTLKELPDDSPARQYTTVAPVSALLGLGWTFVVALLLDGIGDASFRVLSTWIAAGLYATIYAATTAGRRIWAAPLLMATVLGAALIDLGAFTAGR
jgi:hypothetical protein